MATFDVEEVLSKLTVREKIDLLAGIDNWHTAPIPEHGIPSIRVSDGPNGIRGTRFFNGSPAACFPCGTAMGATFDKALLHEAGVLMGKESKAKGASVILGPTINMHRAPLGGRGFESISEDPVLAGLGAAEIVKGIESTGVVATIKHFVCNDQEHERQAVDSIVTQRALREIYLLPFQLVVRDSRPSAFMTSYNKVNGKHVSESLSMIQTILRGEWGWEGLVMSDWFGTYSTVDAVNAGLDLEMPGPTKWRGALVRSAIAANNISLHTLDARAREVLKFVNRCAQAGVEENAIERTNDTPETAKLLRKLAADSIVLMKNERHLLPLKKDKSTLIVGPNAKTATYCGGGSASLPAYYAITPFDGISSKLKQEPAYTVGCYGHKELPLLGAQLKNAEGKPGIDMRFYNEPPTVKNRQVIDQLSIVRTDMFLVDYSHPLLNEEFYATVEGTFTAEEDGDYEFGLIVWGKGNLYVDGKLVIDNSTKQTQGTTFFGSGTIEEKATMPIKEGQSYHVLLEYSSSSTSTLKPEVLASRGGAIRLGGAMVLDPKAEIKKAVALAGEFDQVIICAGLNSDWEGEGSDRETMALPDYMDELISSIASENPNTIVVMQSGTPVEMPWLERVPALIHAWFGGNETGNGIADVLFGDVNPSAKLPLTFPIRLQHNPAYLNYRSERGRVLYGEDVYIGYRWYEAIEQAVLFPFGHGLSYTSFSISSLSITTDKEQITTRVSVKNTGNVAGAEVVQYYIAQANPSIRRAVKELKGYSKVYLQPGEEKTVEVNLNKKYATSFWDEGRNAWISEKDTYCVIVGTTSATTDNNSLRASFDVEKTEWWTGL
ncbi:beta-glucosidase-6 [Coleophoma cylindrospora]|uniref:beta-glucosidase n=1 Tax=Coleophoma cylindrospora TaxID=1849047 RepID=A0A3D8QLT3_9HELO|nr:beta-glucosidase-6 [Coleophoma cylindrospora]